MSARIYLLILSIVLSFSLGAALEAPAQDKPPTSTAMPESKRFTLHMDNVMLSQALADLAKQTGIRVYDVRGVSDASIRLNLKQANFWQAVDAIAAASGARVNVHPTRGRIVLAKRVSNYRLPPISYDGRFRLSVKKVTAARDLEISDSDPNHGNYNAVIEVVWDPDLQPLYLETRPRGVRLVDDKKNVVVVANDGSSLAPVDGRIALAIDVRLPAISRSVGKISTLQGELSMIGPSKMLPFKFDAPLDRLAKASANDPERTLLKEGVTCHISNVKLTPDRWTIQVELKYPPGMKQLDSNQSWVVNNEMLLESTDGKSRLTSSNYVLESATPRRAVLSYHFRDKDAKKRGKPGDWKVSYRTPANLVEYPIKFDFQDIPLP